MVGIVSHSVAERLVNDFSLVVDVLRMVSTGKDYVHDELLRCDDVECVADILYRVGRKYLTDTGLKTLYRRVKGLYLGSLSNAVFRRCADREPESIAEEVWSNYFGKSARNYGNQVLKLIKWLEELLADGRDEEFKKVLTVLVALSFTPGYLRLPKDCFES